MHHLFGLQLYRVVGTILVAAAPVKKTRVSLVFCNGKIMRTG